jgi:hypothetical protein
MSSLRTLYQEELHRRKKKEEGFPVWAKVAISVSGLLFIMTIGIIVWFVYKSKSKAPTPESKNNFDFWRIFDMFYQANQISEDVRNRIRGEQMMRAKDTGAHEYI